MNHRNALRSPRTLTAPFRSHVTLWRRYKNRIGSWPILSMATYALRYILLLLAVGAIILYGNLIHGWTRHQIGFAFAVILGPVLYAWFIIERIAWNQDLRKAGILSEMDLWNPD
jgi:hypothetical protein